MFCMYFFTVRENPIPFYLFSCLAQFFFSGFNTAIYAIVRTAWSMENGRAGLEMMDFSMRLFHWETKLEWRLEPLCLREF